MLSTGHAALDRYLLHARPTAASLQLGQRDRRTDDQTDRRMDSILLNRPCCAYYAGSDQNTKLARTDKVLLVSYLGRREVWPLNELACWRQTWSPQERSPDQWQWPGMEISHCKPQENACTYVCLSIVNKNNVYFQVTASYSLWTLYNTEQCDLLQQNECKRGAPRM